ncbi:hypothetical protein ACOSQ2_030981 [Xanthoceras sorbifolium]
MGIRIPLSGFIHGLFYVVSMGCLLYLGFAGAIGMKFFFLQKNLVVVQGLAVWSLIFVILWMSVVCLILASGASDLVLERLDRCVCNLAWRQLFPASTVRNLSFWKSDHRPILLEILETVPGATLFGRGPKKRFHYEQCWAEEEGCRNVVLQAWQTNVSSLAGVQNNIALCASSLATWYASVRHQQRRNVALKKAELHRLSSSINPHSWLHIHRVEG